MTSWQMYWLTRFDGIHEFLQGPATLLFILPLLGLTIWTLASRCDDDLKFKVPIWWSLSLFLFAGGWCLTYALLPTSKEMAAILIVPKIVNNEKVKEIPDKILTLATEWLEELKPKKSGPPQ